MVRRAGRPSNTLDDVWKKVDHSGGPDACWPWIGALNTGGYPTWTFEKRPVLGHRFAWIATFGPIPDGMVVCHHCDNRVCCNPAHLFLGTTRDNNEDMWAKGRGKADTHGAQHGTYSGHRRHVMRAGGWSMPPCEACREAKRAYERARRLSRM